MASTKAAEIKGVFLRPGASRNKRLYTTENIATAVASMQEAISTDGSLPISMMTSHAAAAVDDALSNVGRVTKVYQESDGSAHFEAEIANTANGRDIANLAAGKFIRGISVRGAWGSLPEHVEHDGSMLETADSVMVRGIDWTNRPGVTGAEVTSVQLFESFLDSDPKNLVEDAEDVEITERFAADPDTTITEAIEDILDGAREEVFALIEAGKAPYGNVTYADPGYQKDGTKRYPLDSETHVRAAWSYINVASNADKYTAAQLSRIKGKIKAAAKRYDIDIQTEAAELEAKFYEVLEAYASTNIDNGTGSITVSGYGLRPEDLHAHAKSFSLAAMSALSTMEDNTPALASTPSCTSCGTTPPQGAMYCPSCGLPVPTAESAPDEAQPSITEDTTVTEVAENATTVETPAPGAEEATPAAPTLSEEAIDAKIVKAVTEATAGLAESVTTSVTAAVAAALAANTTVVEAAAPVAPAAPAAAVEPVAAETAPVESAATIESAGISREDVASMLNEALAANQATQIGAYRQAPTRKGLTGSSRVQEALVSDADPKALSEMSPTEFTEFQGDIWLSTNTFGGRIAMAEAAGATL